MLNRRKKTPTRSDAQSANRPESDPYDLGFSHGVCVALQTMHAVGDTRAWRELLNAAGVQRVLEFILLHEPEEWGLTGFAEKVHYEGESLGLFTAWFNTSVEPFAPGWYNYTGFGRRDTDMLFYNGREWGSWDEETDDEGVIQTHTWVPYTTMVTDRWRGLYLGGLSPTLLPQ